MNFADWIFWKLLFAGLAITLSIRPLFLVFSPQSASRYDKFSLAAIGIFLLGCVNLLTLAIFLISLAITWFGLLQVRNHNRWRRNVVFCLLVPFQLSPLFFYKYADFVINGVFGQNFDVLRNLLIPIGLSFYSFQLVAFSVDTLLRNEPMPKPLDMLNFAGFFPQIVAGPIERRGDLLPQMESFQFRWNWNNIRIGMEWIVIGLFFKMNLADNLASLTLPDTVTNPYLIWLANVQFGLRIYYDFAGYSLMALGVASCLGIRLTLNFASPYCAINIQEFWRRWHISLSTWFRDYVYMPLGGNRTRLWTVNIMIVFVTSGIWHGAGWNFIMWGAIHGMLLIGLKWCPGYKKFAPISWLITMTGVFLAWLCFYETRQDVLLTKLATLFTPTSYLGNSFEEAFDFLTKKDGIVTCAFLMLATIIISLEAVSLKGGKAPYSLLRKPICLATMILLTILMAANDDNAFIYFAF